MILFFNHTLDGHRVEFFHHFYETAIKTPNEQFVFAYPETDQERMESLNWTPSPNVKFYKHKLVYNTKNKYKRSFLAYKELKKTVKKLRPKDVYLMDIFQFMPYIAFIRKTKISGLIGGIYLYTWNTDSSRKHFEDVFKYQLFSRLPVFKYLYVQSDMAATRYFNKIFKTSKFKYICDPFPNLSSEVRELRSELGIPAERTIVLHPGFMSSRKGTIKLLRGILNCNNEVLLKYTFIFAGSVEETIQDDFDVLTNSIKDRGGNIIIIKGYVSFDYLSSLIFTCDMIFIPYSQTNQSSGIIGYGAKYNKPVVVLKTGLLSKIVRKFNLGYIISDSKEKTISDFLSSNHEMTKTNNNYLDANTVKEFSETVIDDLKNIS